MSVNIIKFWSVIVLFAFCEPLIGQENVIHYTTANGLPHDETYGIFQDDKKNIWIGTDDGLVKFDGDEFKIFNREDGLISNFVIDITAYDKETIALATWGGGLHFLKNDSVFQVDKDNVLVKKINKIEKNGDYLIAKDDSSQFVQYKFKNDTIHTKIYCLKQIDTLDYQLYNIDDIVKRSYFDLNFDKVDSTLFCINSPLRQGRQFRGIYSISDKFKLIKVFQFLDHYPITSIGRYDTTHFFAASEEQLFIFDRFRIKDTITIPIQNKHIKRYISNTAVDVFVIDDPGGGNEEIIVKNRKNGVFYNFSKKYNNNSLVSELLVDNDNGIWITTLGNGVFYLPMYSTAFKEHLLKNENIIDVYIDDNNTIFFLTIYSLFFKKSAQNKFIEIPTGKEYNIEMFSEKKENHIRIQKLSIPKEGHTFKAGGTTIKMNNEKFIADTSGNSDILYSSKTLRQNNKILLQFISGGIHIKKIQLINKKLWIATNNHGIQIYDKKTMNFVCQLTTADGLSSNGVIDILPGNNEYWIATSNGLNLYKKGHITSYTEEDGLSGNSINSMYMDQHKVLWIGTQKGLSILKDGEFYNYNQNNGLPSAFVNKVYEDAENQIWIAGNNGVIQIDNTKAYQPENAPNLDIQQKDLSFKLRVISFIPGNTILQYRIEDKNWITTREHFLNFENYSYGNYNIQFRARKANSAWAVSNPYAFSIRAPWYTKWYIISGISMVIATLLILMIYYRLQIITKKNRILQNTISHSLQLEKELAEVRENVARDFHDELGNKLAGITAMTDLVLHDKKIEQTDSSELILNIKKNAHELYSGIKDFIWTVDAKSDQLEELMDYLTDFGEDLYQNKGISFHTQRDVSNTTIILPYYWSKQLLLLFKEAMTNTLKHSNATTVTLSFILKNNQLTISLSDNGSGFDMDQVKRKNGLINMQKRAQKIQGNITINTNKGTSITFKGKIS